MQGGESLEDLTYCSIQRNFSEKHISVWHCWLNTLTWCSALKGSFQGFATAQHICPCTSVIHLLPSLLPQQLFYVLIACQAFQGLLASPGNTLKQIVIFNSNTTNKDLNQGRFAYEEIKRRRITAQGFRGTKQSKPNCHITPG